MPMTVTKMNNGFYKLGDDEYRVEAPMRAPSTYREVDILDKKGMPILRGDGKPETQMVTVTSGKKLRSRAGREDEIEPTHWHLYKMVYFTRKNKEGEDIEKTTLDILDDNFTGTAKEAIAACEAHKAGV